MLKMNKYLKKITALLLAFVLLISCYIPSVALSDSQIDKLDGNWGKRDAVCTSLSSDAVSYYASNGIDYNALSDDGATAIKNALSTLMRSTHDYTSSYNDCHYAAHKTDCEQNNGKITLIYTSYQATQDQWNGWNREHVWPQSLGGGNTSGGGADLHHIRPSDAVVNSTRGNKKYGEADGGSTVTGKNPATGYVGGTYGTYFEPNDNVKGDVARICLYVWVRWGSDWGADSVTEVFQSIDVLLKWHAEDPVDTWEMGRNDVVEEIQGNRNVFIDYPEYAWLVFGKAVPSDLEATPSGAYKNSTGGSQGGDSGSTHTHSYTSSVTTQPTCTQFGVKTFVCSCGASYTEQIAKTAHSYAETITKQPSCTETGVKTFKCTCGASYTQTLAKTDHNYVDGVCSSCGGTNIPPCQHENTTLVNASKPTCKYDGYSGDTQCVDCGDLISVGAVVPSTGDHGYDEWQYDAENNCYFRTCGGCGDSEIILSSAILGLVENESELVLILLAMGISDLLFLDPVN